MVAFSPTPAAATTDYIAAGVRRTVLVPAISNTAVPTIAELNAGTEYTNALREVSGFNLSGNDVDNSTYGSPVNTSIPGTQDMDDKTWTLKASSTGTDARQQLTYGLNAFVVILEEGIAGKMDVWPVRIKTSNVDQVARDALATITVGFSSPLPPVRGLPVPTT